MIRITKICHSSAHYLGEFDLEGGRLARRHLGVRHLFDELGGQLDDGHLAGTLLSFGVTTLLNGTVLGC